MHLKEYSSFDFLDNLTSHLNNFINSAIIDIKQILTHLQVKIFYYLYFPKLVTIITQPQAIKFRLQYCMYYRKNPN